MSMTAFELFGVLKLDKGDFDRDLKKAERESSGFGGKLAGAAKAGIAAVGAATTAMVGFGASAVKVGSQFDMAMGGVAATMGTTVDDLESEVGSVNTAFGEFNGTLRDFAIFMGENTSFSASQAAEALNYMALAGYKTQESMNMLPSVLNMAAAGSMDLARASDMVTDTQSALGLSFERTGQMVDEFAKAASTGNTSVEQLGDAFLRVGGLAAELNGGMVELADGTTAPTDGVQELEIAFTAMANAGVKGAEAGTHMRNMLLKLSSPTADGAKALEAMGVEVFDTEGKMRSLSSVFGELSVALGQMTQQEKIQTISELFNTRDLASAEALLAAVGQDWDRIGDSILQAQGASSEMAETKLDNLAGDVTRFQSALESAQIAVSDSLSPTLRDFVKFGTEGVQSLSESFKNDGLEGAAGTFGDILAQGVSLIVSKLPEIVSAGIKLLGALATGLINAAPQLISTAFQIIQMLGQGIIDNLPVVTEKAVDLIHSLADGIRENLPQLLETGMTMLMELSETLRESSGELISAGLDLLMALVQGLIDGLPTFIETIPTIISNIAGIINDNAPKLIAMGIQIIIALVQGIIKAIPTLIKEFPKIIKAIWDVITAVQWLTLGKTIIEGILNGVVKLATKIPDALKSIGETALRVFKSIDWKNLGRTVLEFILHAVITVGQKIPAAFKSIGAKAVSAFKAIDWKSLGQNIILGIIHGVANFAGKLKDAITDAAKKAFNAAKEFLGIASPSKKFMYIGEMVGEGMAVGIDNTAGDVENAISGLANLSSGAFDSVSGVNAGVSGGESLLAQMGNTSTTGNMTVILELDRTQFAKAVYKYNNAEVQRVGVNLAGGIA